MRDKQDTLIPDTYPALEQEQDLQAARTAKIPPLPLYIEVDVEWDDVPPTTKRSRFQSVMARASEQACCRGGAL